MNRGAFTIRTGFWGILYYNYNKEPWGRRNNINDYLGPYSNQKPAVQNPIGKQAKALKQVGCRMYQALGLGQVHRVEGLGVSV